MRVIVEREYGEDFVLYLVERMKILMLKELNWKKITLYSEYVSEVTGVKLSSNNLIDAFVSYVNSIDYRVTKTHYVIEARSRKKIKKIPIALICKLVSYGDLNKGGYPILLVMFNFVQTSLHLFYKRYIQEMILD